MAVGHVSMYLSWRMLGGMLRRTSDCNVGSISWGLRRSSTSSSISVVSVPFEVTGEGPTKSLGLSNWLGFDEILWTEAG